MGDAKSEKQIYGQAFGWSICAISVRAGRRPAQIEMLLGTPQPRRPLTISLDGTEGRKIV